MIFQTTKKKTDLLQMYTDLIILHKYRTKWEKYFIVH